MTLDDHLEAAATHLQQASQSAADWRIRDSLADAATIVQCALHMQKQISDGKMKVQPHPPECVNRRDRREHRETGQDRKGLF